LGLFMFFVNKLFSAIQATDTCAHYNEIMAFGSCHQNKLKFDMYDN